VSRSDVNNGLISALIRDEGSEFRTRTSTNKIIKEPKAKGKGQAQATLASRQRQWRSSGSVAVAAAVAIAAWTTSTESPLRECAVCVPWRILQKKIKIMVSFVVVLEIVFHAQLSLGV
jgi:hypothetical protein